MFTTLNNLELNEKGIVKSISCDDRITRRLYDLGLLENTVICPIFSSPFGDPRAYEFRGNIIAIRNDDANNIVVNVKNRWVLKSST
mgnify:FL=1